MKPQKGVRGWAEYLGESKFRYHFYDCKHTYTQVLMIGPRGQKRPASELACKIFARYWCKGQNVNIPPCKVCANVDPGKAR